MALDDKVKHSVTIRSVVVSKHGMHDLEGCRGVSPVGGDAISMLVVVSRHRLTPPKIAPKPVKDEADHTSSVRGLSRDP